jgi:hypothetical protein
MCLCTDGLRRRTSIKTQAKSDGLRLLRAIDETQAHGQEGARVDPTRATPCCLRLSTTSSTTPWHTFSRRALWWVTNTPQPIREIGKPTATRSTSSPGGP